MEQQYEYLEIVSNQDGLPYKYTTLKEAEKFSARKTWFGFGCDGCKGFYRNQQYYEEHFEKNPKCSNE